MGWTVISSRSVTIVFICDRTIRGDSTSLLSSDLPFIAFSSLSVSFFLAFSISRSLQFVQFKSSRSHLSLFNNHCGIQMSYTTIVPFLQKVLLFNLRTSVYICYFCMMYYTSTFRILHRIDRSDVDQKREIVDRESEERVICN